MNRPKEGWHFGSARTSIHEICTGFVETGYYYFGGPEKEPYSYNFWGFTWRGEYSIGIGHVKHGERFIFSEEYGEEDFLDEEDEKDL